MNDQQTDRVPHGGPDRHEITCECGEKTLGLNRHAAEEVHLIHVLNDHDDLEDWEREAAEDQLKYAQKMQREGCTNAQ